MRGMFTAGVLDIFMENGVDFDVMAGVSAGAVFGCNFKSRQIGRAIRYNKKYCRDKRYASLRSLITTGDIYNAAFDYDEIPKRLDIFDTKTFAENPIEFYVVATDVETGRAVYHKCETGDDLDLAWMRASASMPGVSNVVTINGRKLLDGGTVDSIPIRFIESRGCDKIIVITTQPKGYIKEKNKLMPLLKLRIGKYPALVGALNDRHVMYNETTAYLNKREEQGDALVIRPPEALNIKAVERDPDELERVYQTGRSEGIKRLEDVRRFLEEEG